MEYLTALSFFFKQSDGQEYSILDVSPLVLIKITIINLENIYIGS